MAKKKITINTNDESVLINTNSIIEEIKLSDLYIECLLKDEWKNNKSLKHLCIFLELIDKVKHISFTPNSTEPVSVIILIESNDKDMMLNILSTCKAISNIKIV